MRLTKLTQSRSAVFGQLGLSFLVTLTWALIIWRALFTPNPPPTCPSLVPSSHLLHPAQTLKRGFMLLKRGDAVLTKTSETQKGELLQLEGNDGSIPIRIEGNPDQLD